MTKVEIDLGKLDNMCFVIMPFLSVFDSHYNNVIRPAVEAAGLICLRADEIYSKPQIMADIWKFLRTARVIIAELWQKPECFLRIRACTCCWQTRHNHNTKPRGCTF
jgi:hypothetical protein